MARVLVIEDNPANLQLMLYLLTAFGHTTIEASDGERGVKSALEDTPDLILCDIQLPGIDGYEVIRQLHDSPQFQRVPIVAVTAMAMVGDRDRVLRGGFDGYIAKPISPELFVSQIEAFIQNGHQAQRPVPYGYSPAEPSQVTERATVLVIDDQDATLTLIQSILVPSGYVVVTASSVAEGLTKVRQTLPDIILTDWHLPDGTGADVLQAIKSDTRLRPIPVLMQSATSSSDRTRIEALQLGALGFAQHPIEPQTLLREIESCLKATAAAKVS